VRSVAFRIPVTELKPFDRRLPVVVAGDGKGGTQFKCSDGIGDTSVE